MLKKIGLIVLFSLSIGVGYAQNNVIKLSSISTTNPYNPDFFEFERSSFAASYEYANWNHATIEILIMYARSISDFASGLPIPVAGIGTEIKYRYYFQTNPNFITYAPYGWYAAPTVGYTQMSGTNSLYDKTQTVKVPNPNSPTGFDEIVNPIPVGAVKHELSYIPIGAVAGYHFIMEEYEYGVTFDFGIGANYIAAPKFSEDRIDTTGLGGIYTYKATVQKLNQIIPKFHFSIGFAF